MARIARIVIPGAAHHAVQRSRRKGGFFFTDADRRLYLDILAKYAKQMRLRVLAWCLLPDHVHLVAVPEGPGSLGRTMKALSTRYSMRLRQTHKKQNLLRGRFRSCPLDGPHMWEAVRYVERCPLRAGLTRRPERYEWSSAAAHSGLRKDKDPLLAGSLEARGKVKNWAQWLRAGEDAAMVEAIRRCTRTGRPAGSDAFVARIEKLTGLRLRPKKRGRLSKAQRKPKARRKAKR